MSRGISINQAINRIKKLNETFNYIGSSVLLRPVQEIESQMKERIFIRGLRPDGRQIGGGYSESWAKTREKAGLQIDYVDLKYTGSLRESIRTTYVGDLFSSKSAVIYINNDLNYEEKYASWENVFELSANELAELFLYVEYYFNANVEKILTK